MAEHGCSCFAMSDVGQTEKSDRPPSRSVLPPEPDIDAKQPAVACGARPVDEFNPNRGRGKGQSHPCRSLKLGPIGACLIRASLFLFQPYLISGWFLCVFFDLWRAKKVLDYRTTRLCRTLQHRSSARRSIAHGPKPALQPRTRPKLPRPPHPAPRQ